MKKNIQRAEYKIENWGEYNKSLLHRGKITLWVEKGLIESYTTGDKSWKRGPFLYVFGDGACHKKGTSLITPPRKDAVPQKENKTDSSMIPRDRAIERIKSLEKKLGSIVRKHANTEK